jgi:alpha-amylase/alpha-mannosidase (GH57 family)
MTQVAILWHMHQPFYEDLVTHEHILPWVRLHALKDYYGMVALVREFPNVKVTFNLVPSLLVQLEAFAADRARDRFLDLSLKPASDLTEPDVDFILENFFHAQRERMIEIYPRYADLLARRGGSLQTPADRRAAARRFAVGDLRDLQVWQKLAWIDPYYLEGDARVRALVEKGHNFTEADKQTLRSVEIELLNRVIPEYRAGAERGQVELSTSPFYHPILPLLCDTNIYLATDPDSAMPRRRFVHPEDAREQIARALTCHMRLFGRRPLGLWPSEGSVSDAIIPLVAAAGFTWIATDELILARTLEAAFSRDGAGRLEEVERLYQPYTISAGGARLACAFRDHVLSDLIGFTYAGWRPDLAAEDFIGRLVEAGRRYRDRTGGGEALIPIILDGENAWEHFEGGGRPFLRALYRGLSTHPELRTVTMTEACATPQNELRTIFPGSWVDANFYIWIGHADDRRAWSQLADARDALARSSAGQAARAAAEEEIFVAEGSDWFWWYGDDHSSAHDAEFDDLFRRHLRNAYRILGQDAPDELSMSNITTMPASTAQTAPTGFISPTLDGEETSYFEWLGAGTLEVRDVGGAMHHTDRQPPLLQLVHFGFDRERLFVRLDAARRIADLLADGWTFTVTFLEPTALRLAIRYTQGRLSQAWSPTALALVHVAAGSVLELAVPLAALGTVPGGRLSFFVAISDTTGAEIERHPPSRPIEVVVPDERFEARNWTA